MGGINRKFVASLRAGGMDEAWLSALADSPKPARGSKMSNAAIQKLSRAEAIRSVSRDNRGANTWAPGEFYSVLMKLLACREVRL